jgi:hypothetical protein
VPALGGQHVCGTRTQARDFRLRLPQDLTLDRAALDVDRVELGGDRPRALLIVCEQQLEPGVGASQPPRGVDPRRQAEAERVGVQQAGIRARHHHQRAQAGLGRVGHRDDALAHQPAVLAAQRHHVGDGRERHELDVVGRRLGPKRLRKLVRDAGATQVGAGVSADRRVNDRAVRQAPVDPRCVVVGYDDVEARGPRELHLVHGGDRAVDREQQVAVASGEPPHGFLRQSVAIVDSPRQEPPYVRAQRAQRPDHDRRGADAVDVVVAVNDDPPA